MSEELWNQEEHTEPVSEKKPETAIDENSQGIYKEAAPKNRGEYRQPDNPVADGWAKEPYQMGQETYQPPSRGFGIASLVLGILSLVLYCTCINILLAVLAIIFGILQLVQKNSPKGMAIGGIVTACLSIILYIVSVILYVSSTDFSQAFDEGFERGIQDGFHIEFPFDLDEFDSDKD